MHARTLASHPVGYGTASDGWLAWKTGEAVSAEVLDGDGAR
jgi:hypothetical protein